MIEKEFLCHHHAEPAATNAGRDPSPGSTETRHKPPSLHLRPEPTGPELQTLIQPEQKGQCGNLMTASEVGEHLDGF